MEEFIEQKIEEKVEIIEARPGTTAMGIMILAKVKSESQKSIIIKNRRKITVSGKGPIYVDNDLTYEERVVQKKAREMKKILENEGKTARIGYQRLYTEGKVLIWDDKASDFKERNVK